VVLFGLREERDFAIVGVGDAQKLGWKYDKMGFVGLAGA